MKKKQILKTLGVLGLVTSAGLGLASCSTETAATRTTTSPMIADNSASTEKAQLASTVVDTNIVEALNKIKGNSLAHTRAYQTIARIKSYESLGHTTKQNGTGGESDYYFNHFVNAAGEIDQPLTFEAGKTYLISAAFLQNFETINFMSDLDSSIITDKTNLGGGNHIDLELRNTIEEAYKNSFSIEHGYFDQVTNDLSDINSSTASKFDDLKYIFDHDEWGEFVIFAPTVTETVNMFADSYYNDDMGPDFYVYQVEQYTDEEMVGMVSLPEITTDAVHPVNVNYPETIEYILSNIHAYDETDGDISSKVELVSTTYDPENLVLGNHEFNVKVSDNAGNETTATIIINVYDIEDPVITATNKTVSYNSPITDLSSLFTFSDNFGTPTMEIVSNNYTENSAKLGSYTINARATDSAGNTATATATITVQDKIAPIIAGPAKIETATSSLLTEEMIRSKFSVSDGYDGVLTNYTITDKNDYANNYKVVGDYNFTLRAVDASGNISTFDFVITTNDGFAPDIYVFEDFVITITKGETLTKDQIISFLAQLGEIDAANVLSVEFDEEAINEVGETDVTVSMIDGTTYKARLSTVENQVEEEATNWFTEYFENFKNFSTWGLPQWLTIITAGVLLIGVILAYSKKKK